MILEIAEISVKPGTGPQFEAAVTQALPLFRSSRGCVALKLQRCVEDANRYHVHITWQTLEDHTVHFRGSEAFQQWRALVESYFAAPPVVLHWEDSAVGF